MPSKISVNFSSDKLSKKANSSDSFSSEKVAGDAFSSSSTLNDEAFPTESTPNRYFVNCGSIIYDVTTFITSHPGGDEVLMGYVNNFDIDIADVMHDPAYHAHSEAAFSILRGMPIVDASDTSAECQKLLLSCNPETRETIVKRSIGARKRAEQASLNGRTDADGSEIPLLVDFSKPLIYQMMMLNLRRDEYLRRMHAARHLEKPARFFENNFFEAFTRTPWYLVPIIWLPIISWLVLNSANTLLAHPAVCYASGMLLWSILEYVFHRYVFHVDSRLPDNKIAITLHFLIHGVHHHLPMDEMRLVLPPALTAFFFAGPSALVLSVLDRASAYAMIAGGLSGYLVYDMTHYYIHHASHRFMPKFMQHMKKRHMLHHYADPARSFGISTDLWDRYFNTY